MHLMSFFSLNIEDKLTSAYVGNKQNNAVQCGLRAFLITAFEKHNYSVTLAAPTKSL